MFLALDDKDLSFKISETLSQKLNLRTICFNDRLKQKNDLVDRLERKDVNINGCVMYNYPFREITVKNLFKRIDIFDAFNVFVTNKASKEYFKEVFGDNLKTITVDTSMELSIIIQNIIYQLYHYD